MIAYSLHKVNALRALFLTVTFLLAASLAWSQSLADIQNVKVDNLSNAQIEQLVKRAEANGINSSQLVALAQERGMPPSEAAKLGRRISELMNGNASQGQVMGSGQGRNLMSEPQVDVFDSLRRSDPYYDLTPEQKKIFGFKLFHNRQLDFSPSLNLPTPLSYIIGAGDQLLIDIYGASQQAYDLTVSPEGRIFIPNLGPIQVGGASVEAATARLKTSLGRIYSSLLGSSPSSFLQLRLGNIRSIKVSMVGEVVKPGTYTLPSFASVFNALYAAGGPNENGAFRTIQVYRNSRLEATVDIYDFLSKGDQSSNITLQDNDVIIVPPFQSRVELVGPVRREGYFEVKPGESLADLYQFAGGFSSKAFRDRVTVRRFDQDRRKVIDVASDQYEVFVPQDGDEILVGEVLDRFTNRVQVVGSVNRAGEFSLEDGMTISELIEKAEGLRPEAFLSRATLYRTNTDLTLGALPIDLSGILEGNAVDVELKNEDLLFIPNRYDIQEEYYVKISGEVNFPGTYPFASQMTVGDLILRSGGFLESAANSSIEIARRVRDATSGRIAEISTLTIDPNLKLSPEEEALPLSPFDHVFIRRSPGFEREQLISVRGEVMYPGEFVIQNANERISDLINRAGGLSQFAYPKGANLIRRTVYYEGKSEDELREESLKQLWERLNPETNRNLNEAERMLFERVDKKLTDIEEEKKAKRLEESSMDQVMVFSDTLSIDPELNQARFKTEDMVGINLEFIMKNPGSEADLILMEGDILQVPKQLQTVRMVGEVLLPTTARYEKGRTLKYYISKAGGFTENARKGKAYVVYANGDAAQTRGFLGIKNYPSIEPGAEIVIPQKPQRERMNAAGWIGIASSLATLGILVERLFSN
ncbi:protein involved in polysaccharide export, contains SLBB domain of the beta-grasp fold [Algoriphagus faecimaris]|uniref:Protein involved in polysaccharide export, contains SLBB domain of the beta-grasp fold n=1 Tax=Algoriphagus faecimaris TaxID=686796 RepID=A0A1G6PX48_9BACT|nr:SLBB domain-containing protein [Algoriphagus faecimaris]SDC84689.1 protein involved in polysaccharide export, contains SLBB domain of the beta-grasp fold [Algoriphagus faecimaris]